MARASKASSAGKKPVAKKSAAKKSAAKKSTTKQTGTKKRTTKSATKGTAASKKSATSKKGTATSSNDKRTATTPKSSGRSSKKASSPFNSKFLERMRKLLVSERETYERQAKQLRAEADSLVMDMDPGDVQFDEESGEGDTIAVERGRDLALAAKALEMIEEIDHALAKLETGDLRDLRGLR